MQNFIESVHASATLDFFELIQVLQHEIVFPNEKRKRANPCEAHRRMGERGQMNVLIIFLDNKSAMPHHSASLQL